jgi:SAM-dependent methyltransferase
LSESSPASADSGVRAGLTRRLAHPLTRGLALDDPRTTELRRKIIREKPFLRGIYEEWYEAVAADIPAGDGDVLELGSGAGFLNELVPRLVTSEVFYVPGVRVVLDAAALPFGDRRLKAVVMTDVLHHLPRVADFIAEAARCVRSGGVVSMVEPWVSGWSRFVYSKLHHEPFRPRAADWSFPSTGPLSGANGALPWIVFERDRKQFESEFPEWKIVRVRPFMPFRYLLSGGVSMRALAPAWSYRAFRALESGLAPVTRLTAMFAHVTLRRS